jgi:hypothetical protein
MPDGVLRYTGPAACAFTLRVSESSNGGENHLL